ncbi:phosphotransferase [uncultured Roseovarius sp.]|uniref:phosphotransferase family protein n=1 Tax=uncultured Roseovarius sp. TaxID=293344 RepID=UPI00260E71B8|nr:phosphotransferase [uncultured Roseovarius sp.]
MTLAQTLELRGFVALDAHWTSLAGGRTNRSWRVNSEAGSIVIKLFGPCGLNPMFPNDPNSEVLALEHLAGRKLAPVLLDHFQTKAGYCIVYEHVAGKMWQGGPASVAGLLDRVHALDAPLSLRRAPDGSHAIEQQTRLILSHCPPARARAVWHLKPGGSIPPSGRSCLLHGDPVPGNIIGSGDDWYLIDWQCPAIGDPCEDLSIFLSPAMQMAYRGVRLSENERQSFISGYPDLEIIERYLLLAPWYHWRMAAYCTWIQTRNEASVGSAYEAEIAAIRAWGC